MMKITAFKLYSYW